jgi:hypothetical protein
VETVDALRTQASACRELGSPMYGELLDVLADDYEAGGPTVALLAGHEADAGPSALGLRVMGSVHRLVLTGRAPELATFYPSVGGTHIPAATDAALLRLVETEQKAIRESIDQPPQTNEVGRAAALYGGLLHLPWRLPVRLFEMGASGGLNLRADRFAYVTRDGVQGDPSSDVRLEPAWGHGPAAWPVEIVERVGADVAPVDVLSEEGRLTLTSYVWPDQGARVDRLRGAMELAAKVPARVLSQNAVEFVAGVEPAAGTTTVLWHSVTLQYLTPDDRAAVVARIEEIGASATEEAPFAHLSFEPTRRTPDGPHEFLVVLQTWPGGEVRVLGKAAPHGLPVVWD